MYISRQAFVNQLNDIGFWLPIVEQLSRSSMLPDISIFRKEDGSFGSSEIYDDFVLHTPKTRLFYAPSEVGYIVDGVKTPEFNKLVKDIELANQEMGDTSFLRTGWTSNKHEWDKTCYLTAESDIASHLAELINFSMMVELPYTTFAVREMIKTKAITTAFRGMPIAREVRVFAKKGIVYCAHPYWPKEAFKSQMYTDDSVTDSQIAELQVMPDLTEIIKLAEYVSRSLMYGWSIDFLEDIDGKWWLTDMALAPTSYHWPDCKEIKAVNNESPS